MLNDNFNIDKDFGLKLFQSEVMQELQVISKPSISTPYYEVDYALNRTVLGSLSAPLIGAFGISTIVGVGAVGGIFLGHKTVEISVVEKILEILNEPTSKAAAESINWLYTEIIEWLKDKNEKFQKWLVLNQWYGKRQVEWQSQVIQEWRDKIKDEHEEAKEWLMHCYIRVNWWDRKVWGKKQWEIWRLQIWQPWRDSRDNEFKNWQQKFERKCYVKRTEILCEEQEEWLNELVLMGVDNKQLMADLRKSYNNHDSVLKNYKIWHDKRIKISEQMAEKLMNRKDIRRFLCPTLKTLSGDVFVVGNTITQVIAPLVLAKTISIPLVPVLFASMAIVVTRLGISNICSDFGSK